MTDARRAAARDGLSIGLAVGPIGVTFGVVAVDAGLTPVQAVVMSLLVFTGASQFAAVGVLASGGTALAALAPALLLAARNSVYGIILAPVISGRRAKRAVKAQLVIDESTAMARAHPEAPEFAFLTAGLGVFVCWSTGTLIGVLAGSGIGDPKDYGLDAIFPAAFLYLLFAQPRRPGGGPAALAGAAIALVLIPLTPAGLPILAAALGVTAGLRRR